MLKQREGCSGEGAGLVQKYISVTGQNAFGYDCDMAKNIKCLVAGGHLFLSLFIYLG